MEWQTKLERENCKMFGKLESGLKAPSFTISCWIHTITRKSKEQGGKQFRVNEKHRVITWEKYWDPKCITFNEKLKALKC